MVRRPPGRLEDPDRRPVYDRVPSTLRGLSLVPGRSPLQTRIGRHVTLCLEDAVGRDTCVGPVSRKVCPQTPCSLRVHLLTLDLETHWDPADLIVLPTPTPVPTSFP